MSKSSCPSHCSGSNNEGSPPTILGPVGLLFQGTIFLTLLVLDPNTNRPTERVKHSKCRNSADGRTKLFFYAWHCSHKICNSGQCAKLCKSLGTKYKGEKLQVLTLKCKAAARDVSNSQVKFLTVPLKYLLVPCNILV